MERYISKNAVVAEIERLDEFYHLSKGSGGQAFIKSLLSFLNTLEVKEVDLDKEFDKYCENLYLIDLENEPYEELFECAKHFFELGLKVNQKEE